MKYESVKPSNLAKESVYAIAAKTRQQLGFAAGGDIKKIVEGLGGRIVVSYEKDAAKEISSKIEGQNDFTIYIQADTGITRDRFEIARELGHYVLHYLWRRRTEPDLETIAAKRYDDSRAQWEVNWFAAEFLMPAEAFARAFDDAKGSTAIIADKFGVSVHTAALRAQGLKLATIN